MAGNEDRRHSAVPGGNAHSPWHMPLSAWKSVAARTWTALGRDNISLAAAGVAFYGFVAMVPMLAAFVLGYGLIAEPGTVIQDMQKMMSVMPADAAKLIAEQLLSVVHTSSTKKGFGLIVALVLALYGARNGASAIITGLDIAYEEQEDRSFVRLVLLSLAITIGGILVAIVAMVAVAALGHLDDAFENAPRFVIVARQADLLRRACRSRRGWRCHALPLRPRPEDGEMGLDHARIPHRGRAVAAPDRRLRPLRRRLRQLQRHLWQSRRGDRLPDVAVSLRLRPAAGRRDQRRARDGRPRRTRPSDRRCRWASAAPASPTMWPNRKRP